jgi:hypothetical protein
MPVPVKKPIPSLAGSVIRYRPVMGVRLTGSADSRLYDGLLDTGADDTVFNAAIADLLGIDLRNAEELVISLAGRAKRLRCRNASVLLRITDGLQETYEWTGTIGFVTAPLHYNLLGHAGFLQFFSADFDGEARQVTLTPKRSFPGSRI